MSSAALPTLVPAAEPDLSINDVLRDTRRLYLRLFSRSVGLGLVVFAGLSLVRLGIYRSPLPVLVATVAGIALTVAGTALVQGALAESVRDVHIGAEPAGILASYERAAARLGSLVGVALLTSLGIGLGFLLFIVPGLLFMIRSAVAVPVVMYEGLSPIAALRRSRDLVQGHGRAVFTVLVNAGFRVTVVGFVIGMLVESQGGLVAYWLGTTLGAALTTPYTAHTLSVLYYRLTEPEHAVIPEPGTRWHSVWHDESDTEQ